MDSSWAEKAAVKRKEKKYSMFSTDENLRDKYEFSALVMLTTGSIGEDMVKFIRARAREAAPGKGLTESTLYNYMMKRISCAYYKGVSHVLNSRIHDVLCRGPTTEIQEHNEAINDQLFYLAKSEVIRVGMRSE